jgi:hypothetical protein
LVLFLSLCVATTRERRGYIQEEIHDLLLEAGQQQPVITLRELPNGAMCIAGAKEMDVDLSAGAEASHEFVMNILMQARFWPSVALACSWDL